MVTYLKETTVAQWTESVLTAIDTVVDVATKKVVKPAHTLARGSVYGIVIGLLATLILFFGVIALFRVTTLAVDVYIAYLIWGALFLIIGSVLWAKK
jgi:hypothetical protein